MTGSFAYVQFMSRRAGVPLEAFHAVMGTGAGQWDADQEDQLLLNVGRTWRIGPEPHYLMIWHHPTAGLSRLGEWESLLEDGSVDDVEERFAAVSCIERAGCYRPLTEPSRLRGRRYYIEYFSAPPAVASQEIVDHFDERQTRSSGVAQLGLLLESHGYLAPPAQRGIAVWTIGAPADVSTIATGASADGISVTEAGLYVDIGHEVV